MRGGRGVFSGHCPLAQTFLQNGIRRDPTSKMLGGFLMPDCVSNRKKVWKDFA